MCSHKKNPLESLVWTLLLCIAQQYNLNLGGMNEWYIHSSIQTRSRMPSSQNTRSSGAISFCPFPSNSFNLGSQVWMNQTQSLQVKQGWTFGKGSKTALFQPSIVRKRNISINWGQLWWKKRWETLKKKKHRGMLAQVGCMKQVLMPGALGRPRGIG